MYVWSQLSLERNVEATFKANVFLPLSDVGSSKLLFFKFWNRSDTQLESHLWGEAFKLNNLVLITISIVYLSCES